MSHNNNMDLLTEMYSSGSEPELRDIGRESPNPERFISKLSASPIADSSKNVTTMINRRPSEARGRLSARPPTFPQPQGTSSESDSDSENDADIKGASNIPPNAYNPSTYENLDVSPEIQNLFEHITRYTPQRIDMEYRLKPFVPEFIPAIGDTDAFLKVVEPERTWTGETFNNDKQIKLGIEVLDEPSANQSDSALLFLQLRATEKSKISSKHTSMNVRKIQDVEKNSKAIDQWINDISDLHGSHGQFVVNYKNQMPDIDSLLQDWPIEEADALKQGFPNYQMNCSLEQYIDLVCSIFDIPIYESRIESLHVLFSMCLAIKTYYTHLNNEEIDEPLLVKKLNPVSSDDSSDNEQVVIK